jgi:hypothetical protein
MTTLCKTYASETVARRGVQALRSAGVPGRDVSLLTGCRLQDLRHEPVGGFAAAVGPGAPVGTFASVRRPRSHERGSFASDPGPGRRGSFADTERDLIVSYENGAERSRVIGDVGLRRFLLGAELGSAASDRIVEQLHVGHAAVLAQLADIAPSDAQARLDRVARAA